MVSLEWCWDDFPELTSMKTAYLLLPLFLLGLLAGASQGAVRFSSAYSQITEVVDSGGGAAESAGYVQASTSIGLTLGMQTSAAYGHEAAFLPHTTSPGTAPAGGTMTLSPESPLDPVTWLTVSFSGWSDEDTPLSYAVFIDDVMVSPQGMGAQRQVAGSYQPGAHTLKGRIYDAFNNLVEVTQSFTVNTAQESWRRQHFGTTTNTNNAANNADPDGDGKTNLEEFAFGTNPGSNSSGTDVLGFTGAFAGATLTETGQPTVHFEPSATSGVDRRALFIRRTDHALLGLSYVVEFSANLTNWQASAASPSSLATSGGHELVSVKYPLFVRGRPARFFRVRIIAP